MSSPVRKRRRVEISAAQKRDLCLYKMENTKKTQAEIMCHFSSEWGITIGRSTVSDILKDSGKWQCVSNE
jgi:hypothetical protein